MLRWNRRAADPLHNLIMERDPRQEGSHGQTHKRCRRRICFYEKERDAWRHWMGKDPSWNPVPENADWWADKKNRNLTTGYSRNFRKKKMGNEKYLLTGYKVNQKKAVHIRYNAGA